MLVVDDAVGRKQGGITGHGHRGDGRPRPVERGAGQRFGIAVAVERVAAMARVARCVAAAAPEEAEAPGDRHRHWDAAVVECVDLLVRVHRGDGKDDDQHEQGRGDQSDDDLPDAAAVELHVGSAQRADSLGAPTHTGVARTLGASPSPECAEGVTCHRRLDDGSGAGGAPWRRHLVPLRCGGFGLTHSKHRRDDAETPELHPVCGGENRLKRTCRTRPPRRPARKVWWTGAHDS